MSKEKLKRQKMRCGDTWSKVATFTFSRLGDSLLGSRLWLTIKRKPTDADPGLLQITDTGLAPAVEILSATQARFTITADQSEDLPVGVWWYDVQILFPDGTVKTTDFGGWEVAPHITHTRS